ncbi:MAG: hypothetical protein PVI26_08770 [Chitinispirillia bacterium]
MLNSLNTITVKILSATVLFFILPVSARLNSFQEIYQRAVSFINSDKEKVWVEQVDTTCKMFAVGAFSNLHISFQDASKPLLDFENYDSVFQHITSIKGLDRVRGQKNTAKEYYAEGKVLFIRAWGMARIDSLFFVPDSCIYLRVRPTQNINMLNMYRKKNMGIFRYYIRNIYIDGYLLKFKSNRCRVCIYAWAITRTKVPAWLIALTMRIVIPRFIADLERYVEFND